VNERTVRSVICESPPPLAPLPGWEAFEQALGAALSVLANECLVLSTKVGNRFFQANVRPDLGVFVEAVSNGYLGATEKLDVGQMAELLSLGWAAPTHTPGAASPVPAPKGSPNYFREFPKPYACAEIARFAVRTLAGAFRVASPGELEYKAFDDSGHPVTLPVLHVDRVPSPPPPVKAPAKPRGPTAFARLRSRVLAAARNGSGLGALDYDDEGNLQVSIGSRTGWIRPWQDPFFVRVHVHLLADVEADEPMLERIHEVNGRLPLARVIYQGKSVFLGVDFPAIPFRAEHLAQAVSTLARLADDVLNDLRPAGADVTATVAN
jgi:hypothetical protein